MESDTDNRKGDSFVVADKTWSFSSISSFETCPYAFKLKYMDLLPEASNFFSELGLAAHEAIEKFWTGKIESHELSDEFQKIYSEIGVTPPPPYPANMQENFLNSVYGYFYSFDREDGVEVLHVEQEMNTEVDGIKFVAIPDFILKKDGKVIMLDYKTSNPFKGKKKVVDTNKMEPYERQALIYAHIFEKELGTKIDEIRINFLRFEGFEHVVEITDEKIENAIAWLKNGVANILQCEYFEPNTGNKYFCSQICGMREHCEYWR